MGLRVPIFAPNLENILTFQILIKHQKHVIKKKKVSERTKLKKTIFLHRKKKYFNLLQKISKKK